jgi:hypothetical protein
MTVQNISKADLIRSVLPKVHERVAAGTFDEEELYVALCTIVRMESEDRSDAECEDLADSVHDWILARI